MQLSFFTVPTIPVQTLDPRAVLNSVRAAAKRDDAIERVDKHADKGWKELALETVKTVAQANARFTTDKVVELLAQAPLKTHEPRALGAVMRSAARQGWIVATDGFEKSAAVSRHRAHKMVWESKLYRRQAI